MPRPKIYANASERQKFYRLRKKREKLEGEELHQKRLEALHQIMIRGAESGDELALKCLGSTPADTALRLILFTGSLASGSDEEPTEIDLESFHLAYYAYEEALAGIKAKKAGLPDVIVKTV